MGLILDSSLLIADERGKFDMAGFLRQFSALQPLITSIIASELLHGVERAQDPARRHADNGTSNKSWPLWPFSPLTWRRRAFMPGFGRTLRNAGK
jgi:hypothetical protein